MIFDLVIKNGTVIEPALQLTTLANIGVKDGKVQVITRENLDGHIIIDAGNEIVCPGFVDIHSHVDNYPYAGKCYALQGITTTIGGNCGLSPVAPDEFFTKMQMQGFPINQGQFVGHSFTLRQDVGLEDIYCAADNQQISRMVDLAKARLAHGGIGISFGLEYAPGSSYREILALCHLAALYGKPAAIHIRHDSWNGLKGIQEVIQLTRDSGVAIQISHLVYMVGMGMMTEALLMIEEAIDQGLSISADSGLYSAFATFIGSAVFDPGCLEKWGCDYSALYVATGPYAHQQCTRVLFEKLRREEPETVLVAFVGKESEVVEALLKPFVMVSTDGSIGSPQPGSGHPQDSGTYPKFFRLMVRETGLLSLQEAIRKCTLQPAQRLGLKDKGTIKPGADADIVIFDSARITDTSYYPGLGQPDSPPIGITHVIVNGIPVVENGKFLDKPGPGCPVLIPHTPWRLV